MTATPKIFFAVLGVVMLASTTRSEEKAPVRPIDTLSSMEALDNARRLETEDVISIRILENKREGLQQVIAVTGEIQAPYIGLFEVDPEIRASSEVVSLWWLRVGISTPDPDIPSESQT